jgi:NADH-quinone oxidoreductase subunit L
VKDFPAAALLWLIPALPLLGAIINGLLSLVGSSSRHGPSRGLVAAIGTILPGAAFLLTLASMSHLAYLDGVVSTAGASGGNALRQTLWSWFQLGSVEVSFGLHFDHLSGYMLAFVLGIGTLIHLYSAGYMAEDRGFARFFAYLNLFIFSMVMLVLGDGLLTTFLGWEGVGLCSYLLIGFWHHDAANNDAARKAFIVNRIGDLALLLGIFALLAAMGSQASLNYDAIRTWAQALSGAEMVAVSGLLTAATLLIFLGCTGKSAQIPLFTWLPDAMAGPTPVSALIHAATMVTAGIFLCARLADVFVLTALTQQIILITAVVTALYAAVVGLLQWDIKKILAYSTVSQLGFMFMAVGVGAWDVALFHVLTHAFFKATLFLGAGSVIHAMHHEQDVRRMGGLVRKLPLTHACMVAGWYAIIGLPLGSGFMSKDLILERLAGFGSTLGWSCWLLAMAGALLTAIYMTRMMYLVFWSPERPAHGDHHHVHAVPGLMSLPVFLLAVGSLVVAVSGCR